MKKLMFLICFVPLISFSQWNYVKWSDTTSSTNKATIPTQRWVTAKNYLTTEVDGVIGNEGDTSKHLNFGWGFLPGYYNQTSARSVTIDSSKVSTLIALKDSCNTLRDDITDSLEANNHGFLTDESDPVWTNDSSNYLSKSQGRKDISDSLTANHYGFLTEGDNFGHHNAEDTVEMNGYNIVGAGNIYIGQSTGLANLEVYNAEDKDIASFTRSITSTGTVGAGVGINFQRARSSMTAVSANDVLGIIRGRGYDGSAFDNVTNIQMIAQSVSGGNIGGQIIFKTSNTSGTVTSRLWINNDGSVGVGAQGESMMDINGSFANKVTSINANTAVDINYHTILVDNGDGVSTNRITITLPQASTCDGREYLIKLMDESAAGNGFTIDGYSTENIYITETTYAATYDFDIEGGSITIQSYNGSWIITDVCTTVTW